MSEIHAIAVALERTLESVRQENDRLIDLLAVTVRQRNAALEDCDRLRAAAQLMLQGADRLLANPDEELTTDDWLYFGASRNDLRAALEGRDG